MMRSSTPTQRVRNGSSMQLRDDESDKRWGSNSASIKSIKLREVWCYVSLLPYCCLYLSAGAERCRHWRVVERDQWYFAEVYGCTKKWDRISWDGCLEAPYVWIRQRESCMR